MWLGRICNAKRHNLLTTRATEWLPRERTRNRKVEHVLSFKASADVGGLPVEVSLLFCGRRDPQPPPTLGCEVEACELACPLLVRWVGEGKRRAE